MQNTLPAAAPCGGWRHMIEAADLRRDDLDPTDQAAADALAATMATWNEDELSDYWQSLADQLRGDDRRSASHFVDVEIVALGQLAARRGSG